MISQERSTQLRVGIFMAIGLSAVAAMVVYFGRFGDAVRKYYDIRVEYPNAAGLLKGASVLLAGAKIGAVKTSPEILPDMDGVFVDLQIYEEVKIPSGAEFTIGSSGLLGDRFVQINLRREARKTPPIQANATVKGKSESGISDMMDQIGPLVGDVRDTVKKINDIASKLNNEVFKEETLNDLNATIANLKSTSGSFSDASKKLDGLMMKAQGVLDSGGQAMTSAKSAADELQKTISDFRGLIGQAKQGRGVLGVLLSDKETADNLKALVLNLKQRGILWYKDQTPPPRGTPQR